MVGRGATVLMRKFGSIVGTSVCVSAGGVEDADDESVIDWERSVPVGVQGKGWKGVGVGDAFGAEVTITKGGVGGAGALLPHPASKRAARMILQRMEFMVMWFELGTA
jgi:hypothetical protein